MNFALKWIYRVPDSLRSQTATSRLLTPKWLPPQKKKKKINTTRGVEGGGQGGEEREREGSGEEFIQESHRFAADRQ